MRFQYARLDSFRDSGAAHVQRQDAPNKTPLSYVRIVDEQFHILHRQQTWR